ncbi:type VI secretion system lipoprotein TssJ [Rhodospirillum sp. A1_3_36]|uniref:type VI secretion system lipoprotein TssJ n=1 Tax=Rhodospirillum sp. A1_3_36 TaxID=3391666 RepID=UPI0039A44B2B
MSWKSLPGAIVSLLLLVACAAPPPPPTSVNLTITGGSDMNGGAPAQVKVYYLASPAGFGTGDFFALFDSPEATLGPDLIAVDTFQLAPERTVTNSRKFTTNPTAVGVVAAFRAIDGATFKALRPLTPNARNPVTVTLSGNRVVIQ